MQRNLSSQSEDSFAAGRKSLPSRRRDESNRYERRNRGRRTEKGLLILHDPSPVPLCLTHLDPQLLSNLKQCLQSTVGPDEYVSSHRRQRVLRPFIRIYLRRRPFLRIFIYLSKSNLFLCHFEPRLLSPATIPPPASAFSPKRPLRHSSEVVPYL